MARYGSKRSFLLIFCARDDLVKVSLKSDARKCQSQVTPLTLTSSVKVPIPLLNFFAYLYTVNNVAMADAYPCDHALLKSIIAGLGGGTMIQSVSNKTTFTKLMISKNALTHGK